MTSITWKDVKSGKKFIKIYRSKDKLDKTLKLTNAVKLPNGTNEFHLVNRSGKKIVSDWILHAVSYEDDGEKAMFQNIGFIPKDDEYL